ncbi:hypothetical protein HanPSC8_Chr06g0246421 [Helianthus annuus]|nr:hypothetical protein HanPSC8_Chr06g0246421 [Helianthus annuus]
MNDQHVISANLLIHQSSQRPGLQHQEDTLLTETDDQPNVAAIFEIPQSSEPVGDHHQCIFLNNCLYKLVLSVAVAVIHSCIIYFLCIFIVLKNYIFLTEGTRITDMNEQPDGPANLLTHLSSERAEEHHQDTNVQHDATASLLIPHS